MVEKALTTAMRHRNDSGVSAEAHWPPSHKRRSPCCTRTPKYLNRRRTPLEDGINSERPLIGREELPDSTTF